MLCFLCVAEGIVFSLNNRLVLKRCLFYTLFHKMSKSSHFLRAHTSLQSTHILCRHHSIFSVENINGS